MKLLFVNFKINFFKLITIMDLKKLLIKANNYKKLLKFNYVFEKKKK